MSKYNVTITPSDYPAGHPCHSRLGARIRSFTASTPEAAAKAALDYAGGLGVSRGTYRVEAEGVDMTFESVGSASRGYTLVAR